MARAFTIHLRLVSRRPEIRSLAPHYTPIHPPVGYQSQEVIIQTKENTPMKTRSVTWMVALALTGICVGQQSEEEKKFYEDYKKSELRTIAAYPDAARPDSPLFVKMMEIENALKLASDPLYNSADKPMILAERAAKELGVVAVKTLAAEPEMVMEPGWGNFRSKAFKYEDEVIPEFLSYKSVRVRKVDPDGLKIVHEFGVAKISIEQLSTKQRSKYGITTEGATQYRKQVAANTAANYSNQKAAAIQAQADAEAAAVAAQAATEQEAQDRANRPIAQAPIWKRFVENEDFRKDNRAAIADEIRRQDGDAAAERFVIDERLKDLEEAKNEGEAEAIRPPSTRYLEGGNYQRRGDRITVNGDLSGGYRIKGNRLYSIQSGTPTHTRSGSMWMPLDSSQPQIRDPER